MRRPTIPECWAVIAFFSLAAFFLLYWDILMDPEAHDAGERTALSLVAAVAAILGQAMWIGMDVARREKRLGWWRFGAIFLGPLVIGAYLIVAYRLRALLFLPLMIAVYGLAILGPEWATGRL